MMQSENSESQKVAAKPRNRSVTSQLNTKEQQGKFCIPVCFSTASTIEADFKREKIRKQIAKSEKKKSKNKAMKESKKI
jgi:hypothetical protein